MIELSSSMVRNDYSSRSCVECLQSIRSSHNSFDNDRDWTEFHKPSQVFPFESEVEETHDVGPKPGLSLLSFVSLLETNRIEIGHFQMRRKFKAILLIRSSPAHRRSVHSKDQSFVSWGNGSSNKAFCDFPILVHIELEPKICSSWSVLSDFFNPSCGETAAYHGDPQLSRCSTGGQFPLGMCHSLESRGGYSYRIVKSVSQLVWKLDLCLSFQSRYIDKDKRSD